MRQVDTQTFIHSFLMFLCREPAAGEIINKEGKNVLYLQHFLLCLFSHVLVFIISNIYFLLLLFFLSLEAAHSIHSDQLLLLSLHQLHLEETDSQSNCSGETTAASHVSVSSQQLLDFLRVNSLMTSAPHDLLFVFWRLHVLHKLPGSPEVAFTHWTEGTTQLLTHLDQRRDESLTNLLLILGLNLRCRSPCAVWSVDV